MTQSVPPLSVLSVLSRRDAVAGALLMLAGPLVLARTVGSGQLKSETRAVSGFDGLAVSGSVELMVRQGAQESVTITADDNVLPLIETVVENGAQGRVLHIRIRRGESVSMRTSIKAVVDVVRLQSLVAAGAGVVQVGALKTPQLHLSLAGSGDARLASLSTDALEVRVAGSGNVHAAGQATEVKLSISGSGDVDLAALVADDVSISIAGSGDAKVTANKSLKASVAGSGDVVYGGLASNVRTSVAGSGSIRKR